MAFAEDLGAVLDPVGGFADEITIAPQDCGTPRTFLGIYDAAFVDAQTGDTNLETIVPRITCKASDAEGIVRGDVATIKGKEYSVVQAQPDGTGMAIIVLAEG